MGSQADLGVGEARSQTKAFTDGFIPNMYRDPNTYPRNATKVLKAICDCLGFGKPTYILEKTAASCGDPEIERAHQVTCDIDGLMCSAMATSTEEAIRGSAFRMSVRLMPGRTFDEVEALQRLCRLESLPGSDVTLLKQLLSLANPTCFDDESTDDVAVVSQYCKQTANPLFETKSLPIQPSNVTPFDVRVAGSTLFSLLGCASAEENVSNPFLNILEPALQLLRINEAPKTFYGVLPTDNSGRSSDSEELGIAKPPEVTDRCTTIAAAISQVLRKGDNEITNDLERKRNASGSSSDHSSKSADNSDGISRVKHYCDRQGLRYFFHCAQVMDCRSPYFKADLTIDRTTLLMESLHSYGYGRSKKSARHNAAFSMLEQLEINM